MEGSGREEEDEEGRLMNWQERGAVVNVPIEVLDSAAGACQVANASILSSILSSIYYCQDY